jgi:hydrogenase maturation protease
MNTKPEVAVDIFEGRGEILVMGVGNYLMGDEGIGVQIVQQMEKMELPGYLDVLDGGTGGFLLMNYFDEYPHIIFVDAQWMANPPAVSQYLSQNLPAISQMPSVCMMSV